VGCQLFYNPNKVVKIKHPFGMLQSNIQVLQDLVGFFYSKTCFAGTVSYEHTFHYFEKIMEKKHELCTFKPKFTHTLCIFKSQNLHILCAFWSKWAHTLYTFKSKFAHTLCANKPFQLKYTCEFLQCCFLASRFFYDFLQFECKISISLQTTKRDKYQVDLSKR